jgi:hypothetical protein
MKHQRFICQHYQHALTMPRAGMSLREVRSWFKYARCPACKRALRVVEQVPKPIIPAYTQPHLWSEESGERCSPDGNVRSTGLEKSP